MLHRLRSRPGSRGLATGIAGVVVGMFVAGLLVPFLVDRETTVVAAAPGSTGPEREDGRRPVVAAGADGDDPGAGGGGPVAEDGPVPVGPTGSGNGPGTVSGPAEARRASDVGVTADTVRIGVMVPSCGAFAAMCRDAGVDPDAQRRIMRALADARNGGGGVGGRRIELVFREFDYTDTTFDSARAACVAMGEDLEVFAVVGVLFRGDPVLCVTEQYRMPFIVWDGMADEYYARSEGRLITLTQGKARAARNQIWHLHELGLLEGRTIGVLGVDGAGDDVGMDESVRPMLRQLGYEVAHESRFSPDLSRQAAQAAVEVQAMRRAGVDAVILTQTAVAFMEEAERQGWRPQYFASDFGFWGSDQSGRQDVVDAAQLDGLITVTAGSAGDPAAGVPPTAAETRCHQAAEASGVAKAARRSFQYIAVSATCNVFEVLAAGLARAGVNPTRAAFSAAATTDPTPELIDFPAGTGFPPGRTDVGTYVRTVRWERGCTCYRPIGDYVRARY